MACNINVSYKYVNYFFYIYIIYTQKRDKHTKNLQPYKIILLYFRAHSFNSNTINKEGKM